MADSVRAPSALRHLPNGLSGARLLAAAPIAWLIVHDQAQWALWLVLGAGLSDVLDGWLAKRHGWQSEIGGWLDPLADKALVLGTCLALAWRGDIPIWLLVLIAARDALIVGGALLYHLRYRPFKAAPSFLGKLTTLVLVLLLLGLLAHNAYPDLVPRPQIALYFAVAALVLASGADYVYRWSRKAQRIKETSR